MTTGFDWATLMRLGLGRLHLHPDQFWDLSPRELMLMLGLDQTGQMPMTRSALAELDRRVAQQMKGTSHDRTETKFGSE